VRISNADFEEVIETPGDDVFLLLDPPYYTATRLYKRNGNLPLLITSALPNRFNDQMTNS
jgi:site-specific DNA-adenine methylase